VMSFVVCFAMINFEQNRMDLTECLMKEELEKVSIFVPILTL
jgi:hypothetical protein